MADVKVLKDETAREIRESTTVTVDKVISTPATPADPKYILEAVAIQAFGLKPSELEYLWPHYVATVRESPLVPCIRCGAASEAENVLDVEGPVFLINRTRTLNKEVSHVFKMAKQWVGAVAYTKESELMVVNGFCESCLMQMGDSLPHILRFDLPENEDVKLLRNLVARAMRQGKIRETINQLRKIVDLPGGSTGGIY